MAASATTTLAMCLMTAAQTYHVPPAALLGIMHVEGGRVGQEVANKNGSHDLGPMQINTLWLDELAQHWQVDRATARKLVRDNACVNVYVAAWILSHKIYEADGNLAKGIARYHSATPSLGGPYAGKVAGAIQKMGLLSQQKAAAAQKRTVKTDTKTDKKAADQPG